MTSVYFEYTPNPRLDSLVSCYWSLHVSESAGLGNHRVLPDGCVDLILDNFSDSAGVIVGSMTKAVLISLHPGARFLGVRFRPGGAYPFVKFPLREIADTQMNLNDVCRDTDSALSSVMRNGEVKHQIGIIERVLERQLHSAALPNPKVQAAVALLTAHKGNCSIEAISRTLQVSRQHLSRLFTEAVGLNPKMFARIVRLRAALKDAGRQPRVNDWAALALKSGYYDQAHLIADFKDLTGLTPTELTGRAIN